MLLGATFHPKAVASSQQGPEILLVVPLHMYFWKVIHLIVLGSAGIQLIFTRSWLGWPKQTNKWDLLYHGMSCSVLKWGAGLRRGFCYSGARWALGGENTASCICFLSVVLIVVFFSLCHSVKLFSSQPMSFCIFSFWFSSPSHWGGGRSERITAWFFVAKWGKITTLVVKHKRW